MRKPKKDTIRGGRNGCHDQINGLDLERGKNPREMKLEEKKELEKHKREPPKPNSWGLRDIQFLFIY